MTRFALIVGYVLGTESAMAITTQSPWWIAALFATYILAISGKPILHLTERWLKHD